MLKLLKLCYGYLEVHYSLDFLVYLKMPIIKKVVGQPRWRSGLALPAAQGVILETLD